VSTVEEGLYSSPTLWGLFFFLPIPQVQKGARRPVQHLLATLTLHSDWQKQGDKDLPAMLFHTSPPAFWM